MGTQSHHFFTDSECDEIAEAVRKAESKTSAEIVPVLATASDSYERGRFLAALAAGLLATLALVFLFALPLESIWPTNWPLPHPWHVPVLWLFPVQVLGMLAGYHATRRIPAWHRAFIPRAILHRQVDLAAMAAFHRFQLSHTQHHTGVLLYVSIFERIVVVLADRAIAEKLAPTTWEQVRDLLVHGLKTARHTGFTDAIARCGEVLAKDFPIRPDDTNELPNTLRTM